MTKIQYMGFILYSRDLKNYIHYAEKHPSHYRDTSRQDYHIDRIIESFIYALSQNNFTYDKEDKDICATIKRIIQEYGCDEEGTYSEMAKTALQNVYKYHGLNPQEAQLINRQPTADWKESFTNLRKTFSSFGTNIKISAKNLWGSVKKSWHKNKKYFLGAACLGITLFAAKPAFNFFNSVKKQQTAAIKTKTNPQKVSSDTLISWHKAAKIVKQDSITKQQTKSASVEKILENKTKYQNNIIAASKSSQQIENTATNQKKQVMAKKNNNQQGSQQSDMIRLSKESSKNLEKACNRAPSIVINDLIKTGVLPANYREKTLKQYFETHQNSHVTEVPSRILLSDIHKICAQSSTDDLQKLSNYVNSNQGRFLSAMKTSQMKQVNMKQIKNLKQLRDLRNR